MIRTIETHGIGASETMTLDLGTATTLLTGDNGSGKTLLLEALWRCATGLWSVEWCTNDPDRRVGERPPLPTDQTARVQARGTGADQAQELDGSWILDEARWTTRRGGMIGPAVYAHADGTALMWPGDEKSRTDDWEWERPEPDAGREHKKLREAIESLVPAHVQDQDGAARRWRDIACSVVQATANARGKGREQGLLLLVDDIELRLHPRWQRLALDSLRTLQDVCLEGQPLQLVAVTKEPLVLASAEPWFDRTRDALAVLRWDESRRHVQARNETFSMFGTVDHWLTSPAIGVQTAYGSIAGERAVLAMREALRDQKTDVAKLREISDALRDSIGLQHPALIRWHAHVDKVTNRL